jgi:hypothetical protein
MGADIPDEIASPLDIRRQLSRDDRNWSGRELVSGECQIRADFRDYRPEGNEQ